MSGMELNMRKNPEESGRFYISGDGNAQAMGLLSHLEKCAKESSAANGEAVNLFTVGVLMQGEGNEPKEYTLRRTHAQWFFALLPIWEQLQKKQTVIVAIDGRCGSGKTTLAQCIAEVFPCRVFHADEYYLPLQKRCTGWEKIPSANMDLERLRQQVLIPAKEGKDIEYVPYSCRKGEYGTPQTIPFTPLTVVEGSYSQHPLLADYYDETLFLTCGKEEQEKRLKAREGERYTAFATRWIPLEEGYFTQYQTESRASCCMDTTAFPARKWTGKD